MALPKIIMDFTNTKDRSGYNPTHQKAGDYRGILKSVEHSISQSEKKTPQLVYAIADSDRPSAVYRYNCPLTEASGWKIRNLFIAAGIPVPKKRVNITALAEKIIGREVGMTLEDDEYEGRTRSQIVNVFPASDLHDRDDDESPVDPEDDDDDDEDDDEEEVVAPVAKATKKKAAPAAKAVPAKKAKAKPAPVEEEDDEDEDEDLEELDIDDL